MLEVNNIHQYYGGSHILRDVSLSADLGQVTVLLGRNGVGKTTLLKSLMGLVPIKSGSITLDGKPIHTATPEFLRVNPQGQIPAMQDGDLILTESLAIALYLARRYGRALGPQDDAETALMEQWALFAATAIEGPALEIMMAPADATGEATARVAAEKLRRPLARLDRLVVSHGDNDHAGGAAASCGAAERQGASVDCRG